MKSKLLKIIHAAINGVPLDETEYSALIGQEWAELFRLSARQGVKAVAFEAVSKLPASVPIPKQLKIQWFGAAVGVENEYAHRLQASAEFAERMEDSGLHTMVLKGLAVGTYYPIPAHREFGDLDCYLFKGELPDAQWGSGYELGNVAAENAGAKVERGHYKHSHVVYKRMQIENHQFFLPVRGKKDVKELERHLRSVALPATEEVKYVEGTRLIMPSADFNALFLTAHAMNHFLYETIRLRNMCDWALFLKAEQQHVNWKVFYQWCDKMHYTRFVNSLNYICHHYLGVELCSELKEDEYHAGLILNDMWEGDTLYNKKHSSKMHVRIGLAMNFIRSSWKYSKIYQRNAFVSLTSQGISMLLDKHPKV